jgi:glycerophosphoryl diester phosphodiesterase
MKERQIPFLKAYAYAHRGYHNNECPENTIDAFERALQYGYGIELDVQLSKDHQVVVFHENDLQRVCGVSGMVKDYTYEELKGFPICEKKISMPLFADVLALVHGKVPLIVELKSVPSMNEYLPSLVADLLKNYQGDFVVQSFNPFLVGWFAKNIPSWLRGQLVMNYRNSNLPIIQRFLLNHMLLNHISQPDYLNTQLDFITFRMRRWKSKKKPIIAYTAKDLDSYNKAFDFFDNVIFEGFEPLQKF